MIANTQKKKPVHTFSARGKKGAVPKKVSTAPPPPYKTKISRHTFKTRAKKKKIARAKTAWELYQADWSQQQIADHMGLTQSRVAQILKETVEQMEFDIHEIASLELAKELERTREYARNNHDTAMRDPRTADTLLKWLERKDKLLGLYVNKTELSGPNGGAIRTGNVDIDISKLDLKHLEWLEEIYRIAGPGSPPRDAGQTYTQAQLTKEAATTTADSSTGAELTEESGSEEANA